MDIKQPWVPLLKRLLEDVFEWDGKTLTTVRLLMTRPGRLTLEFVDGHRKRYTPPVRLYLVISLLFFFIFPLITPLAPSANAETTAQPATESYSKMMFVLLPVFALILKLFYRRHFYLQHLVFSMHVFSAMFLVFALMLSMENRADESPFWVATQIIVFAYMIWYCLTALKVTYQQGWGLSALKLGGLIVLFLPTLSGGLQLAQLL